MKYAVDSFAAGGGLDVVSRAPRHERLTGLDGLRAVAVVAVCLFHADFGWSRGGYLGVDLFFVISGFLITGLLAGESEKTGTVNMRGFYWRRAKRLLPASWAMTAAAILAAALVAPDALPRLRWDAVASLFYATNWELLSVNTSYFEAMGRPPLLQHLWSLAIEEQFYIFWAPVMLFGLPRLGRRGLAAVAAVLAAASVLWMIWLGHKIGWPDQGDPTRLYFGTDTHGFPLLIGAVLGLLWQPNRGAAPAVNPATQEGVFIVGLGAVAGMAALFGLLGEETAWLYPWGFLASAAASVALIVAATWRGSSFGAFLDNPPMRWLGERSYGIYLWHWPIFMLTRPDLDLPLSDTAAFGFRIALTLVVSALSYRFLEMPIRHGALDRLWAAWREPAQREWAKRRGALALGGLGAVVLTASTILVLAPSQAEPPADVRAALAASTVAATHIILKPIPVHVRTTPLVGVPADGFTGDDLTAVGDSVLLGSSAILKATLPGVRVYATVGWQATDMINQVLALRAAGALTPVVLIHLGTNGYIVEDQLRRILALLSDRKKVMLVNTHVPRRWMEANNDMIDRIVPDYPNVVLVNWRDVSEGQPDFFVSDGVHLTIPGQKFYIAEIARVGHFVRVSAKGAAPTEPYAFQPGDLSPTLVRNPQSPAPDAFWNRMAQCVSGAKWDAGGGNAGGLGISAANWNAWGGAGFAASAGAATREQQIAVANRISTQGWQRADGTRQGPIGFTAWSCLQVVGRPSTQPLYTFTRQSVLAQTFHLAERGDVVRDLELMLGLPRDGIYGRRVRNHHLALLKAKGLPEALAGSAP